MNYFLSLVIFLFFPTLLYSQQAKNSSTSASAVHAASTPVQPAIALPRTPLEFFARARQLSDLEATGIPFHLKASYVAAGNAEFIGNGTIEEWWQSKDVWRKEATLGDYRWVEIQNGAEPSLYSTAAYVPLRLRQAVAAVPIGFPSEASTSSEWQGVHKKFSGVDFTVLSQPYNPAGTNSKVTIIKAYYFTSEGVLRTYQTGGIAIFYQKFEPFQNLLIPRSISIESGGIKILAISITGLEPFKPDQKVMSEVPVLPKNLNPPEPYFRKPSGAKAPRLIYRAVPIYPGTAKQARIQGPVIVEASIDETGKIREPYVLSSASPLLDDAALDTIRQSRLDPATVDGKPIAVSMTVLVNFSLY